MLTADLAQKIVDGGFSHGAKSNFKPLCFTVVDAGGNVLLVKRDEKASINRPQISLGKASACIGLGLGGRTVQHMSKERPVFANSLASAFPNGFVPVQGGVLILSRDGELLGAVGVTGDLSENDEACAIAGIEATGLIADCG